MNYIEPENWCPTMHLRYRREWVSDERTQLVLQQRWISVGGQDMQEDWRDIPVVEE
jgi:hypothetical protein